MVQAPVGPGRGIPRPEGIPRPRHRDDACLEWIANASAMATTESARLCPPRLRP